MNKSISRHNRLGRRPQPNLQPGSTLRPYRTLETKKRSFSILFSFLLVWMVLAVSAQAGQVVTDDVRLWAKGTIAQEKALKTISAPNTVAVLYFHNKTGWSDLDLLQKGLTLMLITDLSKVKEIQLVERVKIQALAEELGLGASGLVASDTAPKVGKLLGVEHLIGGDILKGMLDDFQLKSNMLNVPAKEIYGQVSTEGKLLAELFRMEKDLLFKIIKRLKIELTPELELELKKPLTTSIDAFRRLLQGLEESDRGNYERAAESYQDSLTDDPSFTLAADCLRELKDLQLWTGRIGDDSRAEAYTKLVNRTLELSSDYLSERREPQEKREREDIKAIEELNNDTDRDGVPDIRDGCPNDPNKTDPGICGCNVADTDSDGDGVPDCNDGCPNDPNKIEPGICGCHVPEDCQSYTQSDYPALVDESSIVEAQANVAIDSELRARVDDGEFMPGDMNTQVEPSAQNPWGYEWTGTYEPGLQTLGIDEAGSPTVFLNPNTLAKINSTPFLAYAVQVEEDRLNRKILEMHQAAHEQGLISTLMDNINTALGYAEIRIRDDWFTQQADAQAGRVLKDIHGNWVRIQQYILRPDTQTVQVLNVCLRGGGAGDLSGLSTIDWTTKFTGDGYPISNYLKALPWNDWLNTIEDGSYKAIHNDSSVELDNMYVKFTNPSNESLQEQRWFDPRPTEGDWIGSWQDIDRDELTINDRDTYVSDYPQGPQDYTVTADPYASGNFSYILGDSRINVACFIVGDIDTVEPGGSLSEINDIWDALRVNPVNPEEGAPYIGNNNLEIAIDSEKHVFSRPIDVVYIPMSRMLWKSQPGEVILPTPVE